MDPDTGIPIPRKERKFYFVDPFIYKAFSEWVMSRVPDDNKLVEGVIVSHLSRIFPIFYLKRNGEIDIVIKDGEKLRGVEVKYGKSVRKVIGKVKEFIYLTRDEIAENAIPIPLFLALLDIPQTVETSEMV